MRAPHRLCVALGERCGRLDRRRAELLQRHLLPAFPCLASPLHAGPERDPELIFPKAKNRREYLTELSGLTFWWRRLLDYPRLALGLARDLPFVPAAARHAIALSMSAQMAIYLAAAAAIGFGYDGVLIYWFIPVVLAQPFLRALLVAEHTGCSQDQNGLSNTRTTAASFPIRLLMWNMPFHAEHHLYPAVPFHHLPALHGQVRDRL